MNMSAKHNRAYPELDAGDELHKQETKLKELESKYLHNCVQDLRGGFRASLRA